jgi:hypothetical protein
MTVDKYLDEEQRSTYIRDCHSGSSTVAGSDYLAMLTKNLFEVYGVKPVILIDEYDNLMMDSSGTEQYDEIRDYISAVFESALKGNDALGKALLTGVLRISQESMFSKLNNIKVYDVFNTSPFDEDFGFTEAEVKPLVEPGEYEKAKAWYDGVRVGNSSLFYTYSLMSYLDNGEFSNYWGQSGRMDLLAELLTTERAVNIAALAQSLDAEIESPVDARVSLKLLLDNPPDKHYYSLAIQAGYLTHEGKAPDSVGDKYIIKVPNVELQGVWTEYILSQIVRERSRGLGAIMDSIENVDRFSEQFEEFLSYQLSYHDLDEKYEKSYHVLIFGMVLGLGYTCRSNLESGLGRYDLLVETPKCRIAIELKRSNTKRGMAKEANVALRQILDRDYLELGKSYDKPSYAVGVACWKKYCAVVTKKA